MITFSCPCNRTWKLQVHCSDLLLFPWVWLNQWSFWKERSILPKPAWPHLPISLILRRKKSGGGGFWSKYLKMTTSGPLFCSLVSNLGVFCLLFFSHSAVPIELGCQFSSSFITPSHYSLISFPSLFGHLLHKAISQQLMAGTIPLSVSGFPSFLSFFFSEEMKGDKSRSCSCYLGPHPHYDRAEMSLSSGRFSWSCFIELTE